MDNDDDVGKWLKKFFGLPFLEPSEVGDFFTEDLMPEAENSSPVQTFADYMTDTYITSTSRFPPSLWASPPLPIVFPRTTNGAEAFHRHLKEIIPSSHPNIYNLAKTLLSIQEETYIKIQSLNLNKYLRPTEKAKVDYINSLYQQYISKSISRMKYISLVAYKFLPVVD